MALRSFIFVYSFERVYFAARGLSVTQMVALEVIYSALVFALDLPTGALADRWGRKPMLLAARFFTFLEFFLIALADNFWLFLVAIVAAALGTVCFSGTGNAFVYDTLKQNGNEDDFERVQGRLSLIEETATLIGGVIGATIANFNLQLPYFITALFSALAWFVTLTLHEPRNTQAPSDQVEDETSSANFIAHMRDSLRLALSHSTLRVILLYGALLGAVFVYADEFNQVYANAIGVPLYGFGVLTVGTTGMFALGAALAYRVRARFGYARVLKAVLFLAPLLLFVAAQTKNVAGLACIVVMFGVYSHTRTLHYGLLHAHVESHQRATVDSAYTMAINALTAFVGFAFAFVADHYSIFAAYLLLAALMAGYGIYYFVKFRIRNFEF